MRHRYLILLLISIVFTARVFSQVPAPSRGETQNRVLQDISQRTGQNVTINAMSSQQWFFGTYDYVRGLGCMAAPQSPATGGNWQRFELAYNSFIYIYLISDNLEILILCNERDLLTALPPTSIATAIVTSAPPPTQAGSGQSGGGVVQPTATLQGSGSTGGGFAATSEACPLPPRLRIGGQARVTPGDPNWLHSEARRSSEKVGEIPAGGTFEILDGPVCDEATGMNYWRVDYEGLQGWTSEGLNGEYWIEGLLGFELENIANIVVASWASEFSTGEWLSLVSPDRQLILFGNTENGTLRLIRRADGTDVGAIGSETAIRTLHFSDDSLRIFVGNAGGEVIVWETGALQSTAILQHEGAIAAIISTANTSSLIVADEAKILSFWNLNDLSAPLRRIELPEVAGRLEFADIDLLMVYTLEGNFLTALQAP